MVIAIIAILAAILFPVFAKAREKARQASCQSNEKQLGLGFLQYIQDNDEAFPGLRTNLGNAAGWAADIYPYVKSTGVYKCPDHSTPATAPQVPISYSFNMMLGSFNSFGHGGSHAIPLTLAAINTPVLTALLAEQSGDPADPTNTTENNSGSFNKFYYEGAGAIGQPPFYTNLPATSARHTDGANWLACDGHVKYLKPGVVSLGEGYVSSTFVPNPASDQSCGTSAMTDTLGNTYAITTSPS